MIFNNINEYYKFLGKQDKKNKVKRQKIKGFNKILVKRLQDEYNKGYNAQRT